MVGIVAEKLYNDDYKGSKIIEDDNDEILNKEDPEIDENVPDFIEAVCWIFKTRGGA